MGKGKVPSVVSELAEPIAAQIGVEIVDVEYARQGRDWVLRVFIDKPGGVTIEDCKQLSEALGRRLDDVDPIPGSYALEVSSPGIERPLKKPKDFERFAGSAVRLTTFSPVEGRRSWEGTLLGMSGAAVALETGLGRLVIPMENVAGARLKAEF
ncbi:MAG: ribosome maturation factor RimP [Firmicutes bacterium]|nr:ribosome maturation factor RimP [Bacillota bacterium]